MPYADQQGQIRVAPMAILDRRMVKRHNQTVGQVLTQWTDSALEDATWEDTSFITRTMMLRGGHCCEFSISF